MKNLNLILISLLLVFASCESDTGSGVSGDTGRGGSLARFAVVKDHLFVVDGTNLKVFDLSNPENPVYLSNKELNVDVETIFPRDDSTLFIGTTSGLYIYDISNAPSVSLISWYSHVVSCDPVVANSNYAYVTLHSDENNNRCFRNTNQLDIVDISDLKNPDILTTFPMIRPLGLGIYGDTLLVCDNGVKVLDVSNPTSIKLLNAIEDIPAIDIIPIGDLMIISTTNGLKQYRYKNKQLSLLSEL